MKRKLAVLLSVAIVSFGVSGCGADKAEDSGKSSETLESTEATGTEETDESLNQADTIHVAKQTLSFTGYVDEALGYSEEEFGKDGITVEYIEFANGPAVIEALAGESIDIAPKLGELSLLSALDNGLDIEVASTYSMVAESVILVKEDSGIETAKDLFGKKIGTTLGGGNHFFLVQTLADAGISEDDVTLINLTNADLIPAIEGNEVDAITASYVTAKPMEAEGYKILVEDGESMSPVIVRGNFAKENPELTARYIKVLGKTAQYIAENPEDASRIISEGSGLDYDSVYDIVQNTNFEELAETVSTDAITRENELINFLVDQEVLESTFSFEDYIESAYVIRAKELPDSE